MPGDALHSVLVLLVLFQVKHFICDGPLQTSQMVRDKGHYGRPRGILHAAIHGGGTLCALLVFGAAPAGALGLALLDFAIHYHIDFTKEQIVRRAGWTTTAAQFWWALSADQALHQLTYLLLSYLTLTAL